MDQTEPFVTAMIVVRNEENYIKRAVLSLLNQDYPRDRLELLIIDGMSSDRTVETARQAVAEDKKEHGRIQVRYFLNPRETLASGWNIGIKEAAGEFVVRIDAHAQADSQLIKKCVQILKEKPQIVCAGGRIIAEPLTKKGKLISDVLSSPFGVGNARFRYSDTSGYVDTVAYGVYRRSIFEQAGYFNETFLRNQDNDMHGRIKKCGGKFYLEASVKSLYHPRETVKGMMRQAYGNGRWILLGLKKSESRAGISARHLIPLLFLSANFLLLAGGIVFSFCRAVFLGLYLLYSGLAIHFALKKTKGMRDVLKMCVYYWLLHISYGLGSLSGILLFHRPAQNTDKKRVSLRTALKNFLLGRTGTG